MSWRWNGVDIETTGDLIEVVSNIINHGDEEDARDFMRAYEQETPYASQNVGYVAGYLSREDMERVFEWFQVAHPILGTRTDRTMEEVFELGKRWAEVSELKRWAEGHE